MGESQRQLYLNEPEDEGWYVILVQSGYEVSVQRVASQWRETPVFVPYRTEIRQWADRKVARKKALLPGYVIARTNLAERGRLVTLPRVYGFLRFAGQPATLRDDEVEALKRISEKTVDPEAWESLVVGQPVRILSGPLSGCTGEIVERDRNHYFTVRLEMLGRQIATRVDPRETEISLLPSPGR